MVKQSISSLFRVVPAAVWGALPLAVSVLCAAVPVAAQQQTYRAVTGAQSATAQQVASAGVPLSALAPDAPQQYTVRRGDTLWRIAGMFLNTPWRWPELWGMNLQDIGNPHLIYPGQELYLDRVGDRAVLRTRQVADGDEGPIVHVSPRTRVEALDTSALPTLEPGLIEPFLTESLIVEEGAFDQAPRIVAVRSADHIIAGMGDRAYALGPEQAPVLLGPGQPSSYQVFRQSKPLSDPISGGVLGYEARYVGRLTLVRGQTDTAASDATYKTATRPAAQPPSEAGAVWQDSNNSGEGTQRVLPVPATFRIDSSQEEIRPGDRLLPTPQRAWRSYPPHTPRVAVDARVVKVFGDESVRYAGSNQIVVINKGRRDGIETGQVLAVLTAGSRIQDKTNGTLRLPDERNGLAMVFRPFEHAAYALIMNITEPVQAGDRLVNPR
jgi:hypothetical protein